MENLIIRLLVRGALALGAFTGGLLLAQNAIVSSGMGGPRNPAWRLVHGLLSAEMEMGSMIAKLIALSVAIVLVGTGVVILLSHFVFEPRAKERKALEKKREEAQAAIRDLEMQVRIRKREEADKAYEIRRRIEAHESWKKRQAEKEARLKARSSEQVKADAIDEVTKGW